MTKFEVGKTYATRSIGDHNCIFSFTILARTAKTVTVTVHGKTVRRGLSLWNGVEQFKPFGSYSMAAVISADKDADGKAAA
jgi:hypothetical protein